MMMMHHVAYQMLLWRKFHVDMNDFLQRSSIVNINVSVWTAHFNQEKRILDTKWTNKDFLLIVFLVFLWFCICGKVFFNFPWTHQRSNFWHVQSSLSSHETFMTAGDYWSMKSDPNRLNSFPPYDVTNNFHLIFIFFLRESKFPFQF